MIMNRGVDRGPFGVIDVVGMKTSYDIARYWGTQGGDAQLLANAQYLKENYLDKGYLGVQSGRGFYSYPNPAYEDPGFLDVPDVALVEELAKLTFPR
jgi:3-hydroxyacyl-CoA dehydrogenase